jgi:signal transduction histidine kinase
MTIAMSSLVCSILMTAYASMELLNFTRNEPQGEDVIKIFSNFFKHYSWQVAVAFVLIATFYVMLAVVFTKHIVGPVQILAKHIEALKIGNYGHKTILRKGDDLRPLMIALNDLSDSLTKRHSQEDPKAKAG